MSGAAPRETGDIGEEVAVEFLKSKGYVILARNYYTSHAELDIVAASPEDNAVVFVEVKTRTEAVAEKYGRPASAVGRQKQKNLIFAAEGYIKKHPDQCGGRKVRIDVIEVYLSRENLPRVRHIRSAVTARSGFNR